MQLNFLVCRLIEIVKVHLELLLAEVIFKTMLNFWRPPRWMMMSWSWPTTFNSGGFGTICFQLFCE